ncbi:MAG: glucose-6-phosphate isomerase [Candidatus Berkelbacteria bacterium]
MEKIAVEFEQLSEFLNFTEIENMEEHLAAAQEKIVDQTGEGAESLGWFNLPRSFDMTETAKMKQAAEKIRSDSDVFIVIGIGGSYLGARAAIEALKSNFYNKQEKAQRGCPEIYFLGDNLSGGYVQDLMEIIEGKDVSVNVISKSGTTTEPAIAFRLMKEYLEKKYGKEAAAKRIYVTTDASKGALKTMADAEGYETFVIPDNVGGRFSILTPVALLPIAVAGISIDEMRQGAAEIMPDLLIKDLSINPAWLYVGARNILYQKNKKIEIMANYEPNMHYFAEWWKQLFGESEGKENKGLYPASVDFTTDLHSLGQYLQDGERHMFETVIKIDGEKKDITIPTDAANLDGLNYLTGKSMDYINGKALEATVTAHTQGGVPNLVIQVPEMSAYYMGQLFYFFEISCALSAYVLDVNPFDQPGVEAYKGKMFELLGKPKA